MNPPGKTTFQRMQLAAQAEAERIQASQEARVKAKMQAAPRADQVRLRDDFFGIVRLIDAIEADQDVKKKLTDRMKAQLHLGAAAAEAEPEEEAADA
jgi:hypothetical protein